MRNIQDQRENKQNVKEEQNVVHKQHLIFFYRI
jgi:hypothetical protein